MTNDVRLAEHRDQHRVPRKLLVGQRLHLAAGHAFDHVVARSAHGDPELEHRPSQEDRTDDGDRGDHESDRPEHERHQADERQQREPDLLSTGEHDTCREHGVLAEQIIRSLVSDLAPKHLKRELPQIPLRRHTELDGSSHDGGDRGTTRRVHRPRGRHHDTSVRVAPQRHPVLSEHLLSRPLPDEFLVARRSADIDHRKIPLPGEHAAQHGVGDEAEADEHFVEVGPRAR